MKQRNLWVVAAVVILILIQPQTAPMAVHSASQSARAGPYTEYRLPTSGSAPLGMAADGRGTVWSMATGTDSLVAFYPSNSSFKSYGIPNNATRCEAWGLAVDPGGNVWFGDTVSNAIWLFRVGDGSFKSYPIPTPNAYPFQLAFGPDGALYFTELFGGKVGRLSPQTGQVTEFRTPSPSSGPAGIDFDKSGRIWIAEQYTGRLGVLDPKTGGFSEYTLASSATAPRGLAVDDSGKVWVADSSSGSVIRFDPATKSSSIFYTLSSEFGPSSPYLMQRGTDGSIWFNERAGNRIGRIYPTSVQMIEFQFPYLETREVGGLPPCCQPVGNLPYSPRELLSIAVDKTGNLWFSEFAANMIGVVSSSYVPPFSLSVGQPGTLSRNSSTVLNVTVSSNLASSSSLWVEHITPASSKALTISHSWTNPVNLSRYAQVTKAFLLSVPSNASAGEYESVIYAQAVQDGTPILSSLVTLQVAASNEGLSSDQLLLIGLLALGTALVVLVFIAARKRAGR